MRGIGFVFALVVLGFVAQNASGQHWENHDGLSFTEHARVMHGIDVRGKSYQQIAAERDAWHNAHGPGHAHGATVTHRQRAARPMANFLRRLLRR